MHSTHDPALHTFLPEIWLHSVLLVQGRQRFAEQRECAGSPQSGVSKHWTHWRVGWLHSGVVPEQSLFARHATQTCWVTSHTGVLPEQSPFSTHATQVCVLVSQAGSAAGQ